MLKLLKVNAFFTIVLLFEEQYSLFEGIEKGIYLYHYLAVVSIIVGLFFIIFKDENMAERIKLFPFFKAGFFFIFSLVISSLFSKSPIESLKYLFFPIIGFLFMLIVTLFLNDDLDKLIKVVCYSVIFATVIGVYEYFAIKYNYLLLAKSANPNLLQSHFGYFGTTADFAFYMLAILIPILLVKQSIQIKINSKLLIFSIFCGLVLLFGTTRVSVIISFVFSILILTILNYNKLEKRFLFLGLIIFVLSFLFIYVLFPELFYNFYGRIVNRIIFPKSDLAGSFFKQNLIQSWEIFKKHPFFGVGFGNSRIILLNGSFSAHGTFFRLLSETGLVGLSGYLFVLFCFFKYLSQNYFRNRISIFLRQIIPFIIGIFVSSIYNIHFFRLEFWFFLAIVYLCVESEKK